MLTTQILMELSVIISAANIEDIPALLQSVIDHLIQWQLLPESRKPNGCIINYFDEVSFLVFTEGNLHTVWSSFIPLTQWCKILADALVPEF